MEHGKVNPSIKWAFLFVVTLFVLTMLVVYLLFGGSSRSYADRPSEEERIQLLAPQVKPSVVQIDVLSAKGTGFYISKNTIITNWHVISTADSFLEIQVNGQSCSAKVGYREDNWDLAVLTTDCIGTPLPLEISNPKVGSSVFTVGYPKNFGYMASSGIVSGSWNSYMMVDVSINQGNSGGPLLNLSGEVVGVVAATAKDAQGIGAVLAIEDVQRFIQRAGVSVQ